MRQGSSSAGDKFLPNPGDKEDAYDQDNLWLDDFRRKENNQWHPSPYPFSGVVKLVVLGSTFCELPLPGLPLGAQLP